MAWTAPSTKSSASNISTVDWNTYVRDNLAAIVEVPVGSYTDPRNSGGTRTVAHNTDTILHWQEVVWDSNDIRSDGDMSRLFARPGWGGAYFVTASVSFSGGSADGYRRIRIVRNDGTEFAQNEQLPTSGKARTSLCCAAMISMAEGDYFDVRVLQTSGKTLTLLGDADDDELSCRMQVIFLGSGSSSAAFSGAGVASQAPHEWWNTEIAGSFARMRARPMCRFSTSGTFSVASGAWGTITGGAEQFDTDSMHSTTVNNSRATAARDGWYVVLVQGNFAASTVGRRLVRILKNGAGQQARASVAPTDASLSAQALDLVRLDAGDYVEGQVWQESGSSMNCSGSVGVFWAGDHRNAARQRLERWSDDAYAGGAQAGVIPWSWCDIHARDLHGHQLQPPLVKTRARFTPDITVGEWKKVKFNRQTFDPWRLVQGKRNFGEKFVVPMDGVWLTGSMIAIKDDPTVSATFTVPTSTFSVDTATDVVTSSNHGLRMGQVIRVGSTGTLPAGLDNSSVEHFVRRIDANTFTLHPSRRDAQRNTNIVNITTTGSGTHRWSLSRVECRGLNLRSGTRVQVSTTGSLPAGLSASTDYWVIRITKDRFRLATSDEAAEDGSYVAITDSGSGTHTIDVQEPYGARGVRLVQAGEVQAGWHGSPSPDFTTCAASSAILAAKAEDEFWVEALTTGPEGSKITALNPHPSNWFAIWLAPFDYTGADPIADRD